MLVGKGQMLQCTVDYMNALVDHGRCFIKECKRYVSDKIITAEEAEGLLKILQKALKEGESAGGASTLDLHSGHLSKEDHFINIYYKPHILKLFSKEDFELYAVPNMKYLIEIIIFYISISPPIASIIIIIIFVISPSVPFAENFFPSIEYLIYFLNSQM